MNKRSLFAITFLFSVFLLIFACRKDFKNLINDQQIPSGALESAKIWHSQNARDLWHQRGTKFIKLRPLWNDAWNLRSSEGDLLVVPTIENYVNNKAYSIRRVFVFLKSGSRITGGRILEFLGFNYNVDDNLDFLIKNYNKKQISGFSGDILQYDINYMPLKSLAYDNGVVSTVQGDMVKKNPSIKMARSSSSWPVYVTGVPFGLASDCLVTFWHYYTTNGAGEIISETYSYMYHTCPGDSTGGSGSSGGSNAGNGSGSGSGTNSSGGGGDYGGGSMIADPSNTDWSTEPDNEVLYDPDAGTVYEQYQTGTPWPTKTRIVAFEDFVPIRRGENGKFVNCLTLTKEQMGKVGYTCSGYLPNSQTFQTYTTAGINMARTKEGITYAINAIANGIPVCAGVDAFPGARNRDGVTDHFITLNGMGTDANGKYFQFVDNSTNNRSTGASYDNKLYYNETTGKISGSTQTTYTNNGGHAYIVTQIRKSIRR